MKVERYKNDAGDRYCIGVPNKQMSRHGMTVILSRLPGVELLRRPGAASNELFCEFTYKGTKFAVSEPYGDGATYDISTTLPNAPELEVIAKLFEESEPIRGGDGMHQLFFIGELLLQGALVAGLIGLLAKCVKLS
ncbi:MAG: hypothetical protein KGI52_10460 [Burkholderiales bacterium]|nr:hypothetical protein [Burkholderiales bacterium]